MRFPVATAREVYPKGALPAVRTLQDYARRQILSLKKKEREPWGADGQLVARVNHNRWLANCPFCDSGIALTPGWNEGRCFECGAVYKHVLFPDDPAAIAQALEARPLKHRNWFPHETVAVLRAENVEHGVGL